MKQHPAERRYALCAVFLHAQQRAITDGLRKTGIGLVVVSHRPETVGAVERIVKLGTISEPMTKRAA